MMEFIALDFETANESRDSACAVGLARVSRGVIVETDYHLIQPPEVRFSHWNTRVHGLTAADVETAPTFRDLWPDLLRRIEGQLVVAHNASFDMSVLRHSVHSAGIAMPRLSYLCTLHLARQVWPQFASHSLGFLAEVLGFELDHHHAGSDAKGTAELILRASHCSGTTGDCPRKLAEWFSVSVGEIYSEDEWRPSSSPSLRREVEAIEVKIPDGYDIREHPFHCKNVVFTGTLPTFRRADAHRVVEQFGGNAKSSVTKETNFLVTGIQDLRSLATGESESAKLRRARELRERGVDIRIITDADLKILFFLPFQGVMK